MPLLMMAYLFETLLDWVLILSFILHINLRDEYKIISPKYYIETNRNNKYKC